MYLNLSVKQSDSKSNWGVEGGGGGLWQKYVKILQMQLMGWVSVAVPKFLWGKVTAIAYVKG